MIRISSIAALVLSAVSLQSLFAQQPPELVPVPDPPPLPERVRSGESLEPDVTIIRRARETVTEYRINGRLQAIRVEPDGAPAYYLVDTDGDGDLETRRNGYDSDILIPMWLILSW